MDFRRSKSLLLFCCTLFALTTLAPLAFAQNCLQDEFNAAGFHQKLNCTANDVRIAQAVNPRAPDGTPITTCFAGTTFSFIADFQVVTTATSRENIGLYMATGGQSSALTGACVDNIISPLHLAGDNQTCTAGSPGCLGTALYHEFDTSIPGDNCGDTTSADGTSQFVTVAVNNIVCPQVGQTFVLPNCTSWQQPGGTIFCHSDPNTGWPFVPAAVPGSPSKCNCGTVSIPITPIPIEVTVQKACTTAQTPGPATFTQNPNTQSPTTCNVGDGVTTEGGPVTYTVAVTNMSNTGGITVDQICDSAYGNVFTVSGFTSPACAAGSVGSITGTNCSALDLAPGTTKTCTFTADHSAESTTVTDTVSVRGHSDLLATLTFGPLQSNSVSVTSTELPSTATVTKGFVGTEAGCATVRYSVDVDNTSGANESETLSVLTDTAYGDITKLGSGTPPTVLGTTCGVASGIGTLSGTAGAGALPVSIAVGGHYTCQFDGQFCSAVDTNTCISQVDSVSGTLVGDEAADKPFTQGGNTLTVKECFTATVTSQ